VHHFRIAHWTSCHAPALLVCITFFVTLAIVAPLSKQITAYYPHPTIFSLVPFRTHSLCIHTYQSNRILSL
jgi:hypothetical protein